MYFIIQNRFQVATAAIKSNVRTFEKKGKRKKCNKIWIFDQGLERKIHTKYIQYTTREYTSAKRYNIKRRLVYSLNLQVSVVTVYDGSIFCIQNTSLHYNDDKIHIVTGYSFLLSSFVHDFSHAIHYFPWYYILKYDRLHIRYIIIVVQQYSISFTLFFLVSFCMPKAPVDLDKI